MLSGCCSARANEPEGSSGSCNDITCRIRELTFGMNFAVVARRDSSTPKQFTKLSRSLVVDSEFCGHDGELFGEGGQNRRGRHRVEHCGKEPTGDGPMAIRELRPCQESQPNLTGARIDPKHLAADQVRTRSSAFETAAIRHLSVDLPPLNGSTISRVE